MPLLMDGLSKAASPQGVDGKKTTQQVLLTGQSASMGVATLSTNRDRDGDSDSDNRVATSACRPNVLGLAMGVRNVLEPLLEPSDTCYRRMRGRKLNKLPVQDLSCRSTTVREPCRRRLNRWKGSRGPEPQGPFLLTEGEPNSQDSPRRDPGSGLLQSTGAEKRRWLQKPADCGGSDLTVPC